MRHRRDNCDCGKLSATGKGFFDERVLCMRLGQKYNEM